MTGATKREVPLLTGPQLGEMVAKIVGSGLTLVEAQVLSDFLLPLVLKAVKNDPDWLKRQGAMDALIIPLGLDRHWIDCDAQPFVPQGLEYHEEDQLPSRVRGRFLWDKSKAGLWLSEGQKGSGVIRGTALLEEIKRLNKPVYPVQVLDFLLENPDQIPEEWKGKYTFFWTPYRRVGGYLYVRCLCWGGKAWRWFYDWLDNDWHSVSPAAVPASIS